MHAFASVAGGARAYCICAKHSGPFVLERLLAVDATAPRCRDCEARARMFAIALPHADRAAARLVDELRAQLRRIGLRGVLQ